ncbi:hypothetical protein [Pyxidicoccus xibeiensis]|uniref:hypothetical protein n=1 Tax=Pyxidicoccus xibeiensis TaxID=2906759 RepID=UPI0020A79FEA|nr:hypothetical protein [Pyxidicoccus xibeiensis]MCP3137983.1 hypothetical protein [Pyxidicoccus xibeiensis]
MSNKSRLRVNLSIRNHEGTRGTALANTLKRLALVFDDIYITPPNASILNESFLNNPQYVTTAPDGKIIIHADKFNYFRDTTEAFELTFESFRNSDLKETLLSFREAGIIKNPDTNKTEDTKEIAELRNRIVANDVSDKEFNRLSKTKQTDYALENNIKTIMLKRADEPDDKGIVVHTFRDPPAVFDSKSITRDLFNSERLESAPVFLEPTHRAEIEYKYNQYKNGLDILRRYHPNALTELDFRSKLGEVAFTVSNELFDSGALSLCTPAEIIKYRVAMEEARLKYVSGDIINIASMIKDSPWSPQTRLEISKYIVGKLNVDLKQYESQSKNTYRKFFGQIATHTASMAIGGGIGTLLGNILPNSSPWSLVLIGSLVGAAKESPQIVRSIVDMWLQRKTDRGSAIAFVAEFENRTSIKRRKQLMGIEK